ncbi:Ctr copper transporter family-domain-containing protein [Podospora australis]|uniref:Copper transport protein n=1 Tax=Podospora australis TaxID=1536484 RepID=A0AAN6WI38_9PEZI|nr:Ctr copper transporter family-domain-containing protein [Podospora australis]
MNHGDHAGHDMASMTSTVPGATATPAMSMGGHGGRNDCKISMLWNWYTIDTCFIAESWRVTSYGMFGGTCICVLLLVMLLELLRRSISEQPTVVATTAGSEVKTSGSDDGATVPVCSPVSSAGYRPSFLEQAVRAFLHTAQFAVAYFVMLLAMYYNGYLIICIFIGAYLGAFIFQWEALGASGSTTTAAAQPTVCCG